MTQDEALSILKIGANVFLTGEPGSGKTHTINRYVQWLREHYIEPAITASTGIAATHIGGRTIHLWSGIGVKNKLTSTDLSRIASNARIAKRVRETNILIIDEVSMLSVNTLVMVEAVCRKIRDSVAPFGGLQLVLVGDFFQLTLKKWRYLKVATQTVLPCYYMLLALPKQERLSETVFVSLIQRELPACEGGGVSRVSRSETSLLATAGHHGCKAVGESIILLR